MARGSQSGMTAMRTTKTWTPAAVERLAEIQDAAVQLFYERGFHGTDLRLIAQQVGMHPSSFYNYIGSKQELLYLILRNGIDRMNEGLAEAVAGIEDPVAALMAAIRFHVTMTAHSRFHAWTEHVETRALEGEFRDLVFEERKKYEAQWVALIERGVATGVFHPSHTKVAVFGLISMAQISRWYSPGGALSPEQIADVFCDIILRGLAGVLPEGVTRP
jgi:AcrR family transcriptional regulator